MRSRLVRSRLCAPRSPSFSYFFFNFTPRLGVNWNFVLILTATTLFFAPLPPSLHPALSCGRRKAAVTQRAAAQTNGDHRWANNSRQTIGSGLGAARTGVAGKGESGHLEQHGYPERTGAPTKGGGCFQDYCGEFCRKPPGRLSNLPAGE